MKVSGETKHKQSQEVSMKYAEFMSQDQELKLMEEIRAEDEAYASAFAFGGEHSFCDCDNCTDWWREYDQ